MRALKLPIRTARLTLREFRRSDLEPLAAWSADARVTRHMFFGPRDADASLDHLNGILDSQSEIPRTRYELAIEQSDSGLVIGACDLSMIERAVLDLGYLLAHGSWGQGFATEVALALIDAAFLDLQAERVISTVDISNRASIRVLEKAGLQWEATYRKARRAKNRWWDCHLYVIARAVWDTREHAP